MEIVDIKTALNERWQKQREATQNKCNHRKGGDIHDLTQGNSDKYAVIKHELPTGGLLVICQRCGKEWHPYNKFTGAAPTPGWEVAVNFYTDNVSSGSSSFNSCIEEQLRGLKQQLVKLGKELLETRQELAQERTKSIWTRIKETIYALLKARGE